jgi:hypothetical protein
MGKVAPASRRGRAFHPPASGERQGALIDAVVGEDAPAHVFGRGSPGTRTPNRRAASTGPTGRGSGQDTVDRTGANARNRRLFSTTNTEENAIAAPAIMGLRNPNAASGIAATL